MDIDLSRQKFDNLTSGLVERTLEPMRKAMQDAGLSYGDISKVIFVGGSTRIPAVFDKVKQVTGKEPFKGINPDECVAIRKHKFTERLIVVRKLSFALQNVYFNSGLIVRRSKEILLFP